MLAPIDHVTDYLAFPPVRCVRGTVRVPSSKSATNRALVLAALSEQGVEIVRPLESDDTAALSRCLIAMGASISRSADGIKVRGPLGNDARPEIELDVCESGTAARFLTAVAAAVPGRYRITGSGRLTERPIEELVLALRSSGARIDSEGRDGGFPLVIAGGTLRSGRVSVDASRSSQFVSALLLAGAALDGGLEVDARGKTTSAPYIRATLDALEAFGHRVETETLRVRRSSPTPARYEVPGDFSSALPLLASAGIAGGSVTVEGVSWPSADADALAVPVLERLGIEIQTRPGELTASARGPLAPVVVPATDFPDAVPALAALAAFVRGKSRFEGVRHLRFKESDRIDSLVRLLGTAGARVEPQNDGFTVTGPLDPGRAGAVKILPTARDHRIAMAAGLLSLRVPGTLVEAPGCVAKSYPGFFRDLDSLAVREL